MARNKRKNRTVPYDPAEAARQAAERARYTRNTPAEWGANREALKLSQNADVQVIEATRHKVSRVTRFDCFAMLHSRGALGRDDEGALRLASVRRLEADIATRFQVEGAPELILVDGGGHGGDPMRRRAIDAARRIEGVLSMVGAQSARLLLALCEPAVQAGQPVNNWREVVERVTGEHLDHGQVAVVRAAAQNLAEAWASYDNMLKKVA